MTSEDFFRKICTSHFTVRVRKGFLRVLLWEGVGDRIELQYILTPLLWPSALCLFRSPDAQPEARGLSLLLSAGFLYHILSLTGLRNYWEPRGPLRPGVAFPTISYQQPLRSPTQSGAPSPFGLVWLSLPHSVSNSTRSLSDFLSWPSYIIVQRPLNRPLNLWNGMFDCHQAEITVMKFRGHFLPIHQSMSVPWDFLPCFISSAKPA